MRIRFAFSIALFALMIAWGRVAVVADRTTGHAQAPRGYELRQFTPRSATTWWASLTNSTTSAHVVVRTTDSGQHWQNVTPTFRDDPEFEIFFLNADTGWIASGSSENLDRNDVYRTRDAGQTWPRMGTVPSCEALDFVDATHGWCADIGGAAGSASVWLYRTTDGGATWPLVSRTNGLSNPSAPDTPDNIPFACDKTIAFASSTIGWASSHCTASAKSYLYGTIDGGVSWHPRQVPLPSSAAGCGAELGTPVVDGQAAALAIWMECDAASTSISTSADGGTTWNTKPVSGPPKRWSVDLIDPSHWRLTDGAVLMLSDDAGATWQSRPLAPLMRRMTSDAFDLKFVSPLTGFAVPKTTNSPVWWTADGGVTWTSVAITVGPRIQPH
jgi:photosystem II stability/assembly factor-like uncharacterized protein